MPVSQTLIAAEVAPERRGLAQGITQIFGANLLANFLGPIVIVAIGASMGWRNAFFVSALPGFFSAVLLWMLVREPEVAAAASEAPRGRSALLPLLADRTLLLCILIATLLVAFFVVFMTFMPLYLTQVRGVTNQGMSYIMSTFGLASMAVAFLVPGSSDRFGRKPVVVVTFLVGLILPLGVLLTSGSDPLPLVVSIALGCCVSGCFPLVMATIPSEHVAAAQTATALSLTMGISEVVGGVAAPYFAGGIADAYGLGAVMWILAGICLSCALLALMLKETAPRVLALRRAVP
jgi:predicted MFS family arabinose efflux permease